MADKQISLPGLPIFRRYSLALKQEFGEGEDVARFLEESLQMVNDVLEPEEVGRKESDGRSRRVRRKRETPVDFEAETLQAVDDGPPETFLKEAILGPIESDESVGLQAVDNGPEADLLPERGRAPSPEEEAEFWGDKRRLAKLEKAKAKGGRRSPRAKVVRVGREGKLEGADKPSDE